MIAEASVDQASDMGLKVWPLERSHWSSKSFESIQEAWTRKPFEWLARVN